MSVLLGHWTWEHTSCSVFALMMKKILSILFRKTVSQVMMLMVFKLWIIISSFRWRILACCVFFSRLGISQRPHGVILSQQIIFDIFDRATLFDLKVSDSPIQSNVKLWPIDGEFILDPWHLVGQLVYLCTNRWNISHVVGIMSQFVAASWIYHHFILIRILRYLDGTVTRSLMFLFMSLLEF